MKPQELDNELKSLIKGIKIDSPGNDFTSKVMNRVYEEKTAMEKVKNEKLFGKGFWIILLLFVVLFVALYLVSPNGAAEESMWSKLFSNANEGAISQGYQSLFSNLGTLPLSIGGILFASSILLFIDKFLPQIIPHRTPQELF